ncbi:MAG TPA: hypothetical protein VHU83_06640 [Bryobacteraceae bacterium]|jgi:hypothetical protein|nr:hypothetical protein [Bryobacteraceae bacterium]
MKTIAYRSLDESDKARVSEWLKNDPEHQTADCSLFTDAAPGRTQFAVDEDGAPVFYVCVENVARVHIQFEPGGGTLKNAKTLITGFRWLIANLKQRGYHELIFDSRFQPLIRFCEKAMGFLKREQDYSARL